MFFGLASLSIFSGLLTLFHDLWCALFTSLEGGSLMPNASVRLEGCLGDRPFLEAWLASHYFGLSCSEIGMLPSLGSMCCFRPVSFLFALLASCAASRLKGCGHLRNRLLSFWNDTGHPTTLNREIQGSSAREFGITVVESRSSGGRVSETQLGNRCTSVDTDSSRAWASAQMCTSRSCMVGTRERGRRVGFQREM